MAEVKAYRFPIKCLGCGLHFNVYSWQSDWAYRTDPHCPECGLKESTLVMGRESLHTEVHEHVSVIDKAVR